MARRAFILAGSTVVVALVSFFVGVRSAHSGLAAAPCLNDLDCDDGVYCNGQERCVPDGQGHGVCAPASLPRCVEPLETCYETSRICRDDNGSCNKPNPDSDNDGRLAIGCGGDDCDDSDLLRFPGRPEVCQLNYFEHDEDCNPLTFGDKDDDRDGLVDARCCNRDDKGVLHCGTDPNDNNPSIQQGSQTCAGATSVRVGKAEHPCPAAHVCVTQPNGLGVCVPPLAPGACTIYGDRVGHGMQRCSPFAPERVYVCDNGAARLDRCPAGTMCIQQANGTGWCQITPPGWKAPEPVRPPAIKPPAVPKSPVKPIPRPPTP